MNINQRINQNFKGIVIACKQAEKITNKDILATTFFNGQKDPTLCKTSWIKASKRLKKSSNLTGVGVYLKSEPFIN